MPDSHDFRERLALSFDDFRVFPTLDPKDLEELEEILDGTPYIKLSIQDGCGIDELRTEVLRMLGEVRVVLDAMAIVDVRSARAD